VKNLAESKAVQNAVNDLIALEEQPRGPDSVDKIRKIFEVFSNAEDQDPINKILDAHFPIVANHTCPL